MATVAPSADDLVAASKEYNARRKDYLDYYSYYRGLQELKFATRAFSDEYGKQFEGLRENLLPGLISAFTDNLGIASWGSEKNDKIEKDLGLKRLLGMVNDETFRTGDGYVLVWPNAKNELTPHYQRAFQMVPMVDPDNPDMLLWVARIWFLGKKARINIYYADRVERWVTVKDLASLDNRGKPQITVDLPEVDSGWEPYEDNDPFLVAHNFEKVPAIWAKQDALDPFEHGISILDDAIPLQDMLNRELADTMVLSGAYSKPFWYLLNYQPQAGENPLLAAQNLANAYAGIQQTLAGTPSNLMPGQLEAQAKAFRRSEQSIFAHDGPGPFGQLEPPDILKLLDFQDRIALKMCRVIGLPSYYMTQTSNDVPSGASLRVLKSRMTSRIGRFQRDAEPVLKGLGELLGMTDVGLTWDNPEQLDPIEQLDVAVSKKRDLGYSLEDAIKDLDEDDVAGIVARAAQKATEALKQFQDGALGMGSDPTNTDMSQPTQPPQPGQVG